MKTLSPATLYQMYQPRTEGNNLGYLPSSLLSALRVWMVVGWPERAYIVLTHADRFVEALSETCRFGDVRVSCAVYNMQCPGPTPVLRRTTASSTKHTGSKKRRLGLVVSSRRYLCLIRPQQALSFFIYIHALPTSEQTYLGLNVVPRAKGSPSSVKG